MTAATTLGLEEGCIILSYDGVSTFNSIYRHRFLPSLAGIVSSVTPYESSLYAPEPPKLLFSIVRGGLEVIELAWGVQQGCNLDLLFYIAGLLKTLIEFWVNPPVPGARAISFFDNITTILPPKLSVDMAAVGKVMEWLQKRRGVKASR